MTRHVRLATEHDAAAFAAIYRPVVEGTGISFETEAPSPVEMAARVRQVLATHPWVTYERDGEVAGYAYASKHRDRAAYRFSVDVAVYVAEAWRGRGVGRALYAALLPVLRAQGFHAAHAGIALPNEASVALHQALGFEAVGVYRRVGWKLGAWRDVSWWQLELSPRVEGPAPREPSGLAEALASEQARAALGG